MTWGRCILMDKDDGGRDCVQEVARTGNGVERHRDEEISKRSGGFADRQRTLRTMTSRSQDVF